MMPIGDIGFSIWYDDDRRVFGRPRADEDDRVLREAMSGNKQCANAKKASATSGGVQLTNGELARNSSGNHKFGSFSKKAVCERATPSVFTPYRGIGGRRLPEMLGA